jgi:hypothetical protein
VTGAHAAAAETPSSPPTSGPRCHHHCHARTPSPSPPALCQDLFDSTAVAPSSPPPPVCHREARSTGKEALRPHLTVPHHRPRTYLASSVAGPGDPRLKPSSATITQVSHPHPPSRFRHKSPALCTSAIPVTKLRQMALRH